MTLELTWILGCNRCGKKVEQETHLEDPGRESQVVMAIDAGWVVFRDDGEAYCPHCVEAAPALVEEVERCRRG